MNPNPKSTQPQTTYHAKTRNEAAPTQDQPKVPEVVWKKSALEAEYVFKGKRRDPRFGDVAIVEHKQTKEQLEVRETVTNNEKVVKNLIHKAMNRIQLKGIGIPQLYDYSVEKKSTFCSTNYVMKEFWDPVSNDLEKELKKREKNKTGFKEKELTFMIYNTTHALAHMNDLKLNHKHIAPLNIDLGKSISKPDYKLIDVKDNLTPEEFYVNDVAKGKDIFVAPELLHHMKMKKEGRETIVNLEKSDSFSLGMCILKAGTMSNLNDCYDHAKYSFNEENLKRHFEMFRETFQDNQLLYEAVDNLIAIDPNTRWNAQTLRSEFPDLEAIVDYFVVEEIQEIKPEVIQVENMPLDTVVSSKEAYNNKPVENQASPIEITIKPMKKVISSSKGAPIQKIRPATGYRQRENVISSQQPTYEVLKGSEKQSVIIQAKTTAVVVPVQKNITSYTSSASKIQPIKIHSNSTTDQLTRTYSYKPRRIIVKKPASIVNEQPLYSSSVRRNVPQRVIANHTSPTSTNNTLQKKNYHYSNVKPQSVSRVRRTSYGNYQQLPQNGQSNILQRSLIYRNNMNKSHTPRSFVTTDPNRNHRTLNQSSVIIMQGDPRIRRVAPLGTHYANAIRYSKVVPAKNFTQSSISSGTGYVTYPSTKVMGHRVYGNVSKNSITSSVKIPSHMGLSQPVHSLSSFRKRNVIPLAIQKGLVSNYEIVSKQANGLVEYRKHSRIQPNKSKIEGQKKE